MVAAIFIFGEMILLPVNGQIVFPLSYLRVIGTAMIVAGTVILNIYYKGIAEPRSNWKTKETQNTGKAT